MPWGAGNGWGQVGFVGQTTAPAKPSAGPGSPKALSWGPQPNGYLTFQGVGFTSGRENQFSVLCGDQRPQITDGYALWGTIARPLLQGVTVPQGFNPASMLVNVRFGVWDSDGWHTDADGGTVAGERVERDVSTLEWMAGAQFTGGPSPVVYVGAFGQRGETPLIPARYQGLPWVISQGITWGTSISNANGYRVYQEASLTLLNFLGYNRPPAQRTRESGGTFTATKAQNTPLKIAAAPSSQSPPGYQATLAKRIVDAPQNKKLKLRNVNTPIKPGAHVYVPAHQI